MIETHDAHKALSHAALESRLTEWATEYGGGRYEDNGWRTRNLISTLMEFGGFVPESGGHRATKERTPADEVEDVVLSMERAGYVVHSAILRCDYFQPRWPISMRLTSLGKAGIWVSKPGYYLRLNEAKMFAAGALKLSLPACV